MNNDIYYAVVDDNGLVVTINNNEHGYTKAIFDFIEDANAFQEKYKDRGFVVQKSSLIRRVK